MFSSGSGCARTLIYFILFSFFLTLLPEEAQARRRFFGPRRGGPRGMVFRRGGRFAPRRFVMRGMRPRRFVGQPRLQQFGGQGMQRVILGRDELGNEVFSQNLVRDQFGRIFAVSSGLADSTIVSGGQSVVDPSSISDEVVVGANGRLLSGVGSSGRILNQNVIQDIQVFNSGGLTCSAGGRCSSSGF